MKFKKREEPFYTSELHYDLFTGGYIDPFDFLSDPKEAQAVLDAMNLINEFCEAAEDEGVIEIG